MEPLVAYDVMRSRKYHNVLERGAHLSGQRVKLADTVDLVAEELHAYRGLVCSAGGEYLERVALGAELVSSERKLVALILYFDKAFYNVLAAYLLTLAEGQRIAAVVLRAAQGIYTRNRSHNDNVPPLGKRHGRGVPQAVYFVVYRAVLFNVCVGGGNVRLRLVVVVI